MCRGCRAKQGEGVGKGLVERGKSRKSVRFGKRERLLSSSISIHKAVAGRWGRNGRWTFCNMLNCLMRVRLKRVASGWKCL